MALKNKHKDLHETMNAKEASLKLFEANVILALRKRGRISTRDIENVRYWSNKLCKLQIDEARTNGTLDSIAFPLGGRASGELKTGLSVADRGSALSPSPNAAVNSAEHRHRYVWTSIVWAGHQTWICPDCGDMGRKNEFLKRFRNPAWEIPDSPTEQQSTQEIWENAIK